MTHLCLSCYIHTLEAHWDHPAMVTKTPSKETSALQRNRSNVVHHEKQTKSLLSSPVIHLKVWFCILDYFSNMIPRLFFKYSITSEI